MLVNATNQIQTQSLQQTQKKSTGYFRGYSFSLTNIPGNLCKISIPVLAILSLANIPEVNGGPLAYALCVEVCFASLAWCPPLLPTCVFGCIPLLTAPTP